MKTWSFFRPETGEICDYRFSGPENALPLNTPAGTTAIEGEFDHLSQRIENGGAVDWQPPSPGDDYEWRERRWVLKADVADRQVHRAMAQQRILDWESKQSRALRELAINPDDAFAKARLQQINDQIALLRTEL